MFSVPSRVFLSAGISKTAGDFLAGEGFQKVLFICDNHLAKIGLTDDVVESITRAGIKTIIFDKVNGEPPYTLVEEAVDVGRVENIDAIVGMGGGSALDVAKCTSIMLGNNADILKFADTFGEVPKKGPFIALIPTTFGTGSEVTEGAVLSIPEENRKITIWGKNAGGDMAFIDPELALGLPEGITASTGMDALSHAVEAYTSPMASPISDILAVKAIETILEWLPKCIKDGMNIENRSNMCLGAMLAGVAFNNGGLNQGHELAHALGAKFHVPHGTACAISLPLAVRANAVVMPGRIAYLGKLFGINTNRIPEKDIEDELVEKIISLRKCLGVQGLKELGITEDQFEAIADAWDAEPKGEYAFEPDHEYIVEFLKTIY